MSEKPPTPENISASATAPPADISIESLLGLTLPISASSNSEPQGDKEGPKDGESLSNPESQAHTSITSSSSNANEPSNVADPAAMNSQSEKHPLYFVDESTRSNESSAGSNDNIDSRKSPSAEAAYDLNQGKIPETQDAMVSVSALMPTFGNQDDGSKTDSESYKPFAPGQPISQADLKTPMSAQEEEVFEQFLRDEADYVSRGDWDLFPTGSRLFIGNLPTDILTKKHMFRIFYRFGTLAQISLKQAYGFVQFLNAEDCAKAIEVEQGVPIQGRKMHLEVSRPQGAKRNNERTNRTESSRYQRRSQSPDRDRGRRIQSSRTGGTYGGYLSRTEDSDEEYGRDRYSSRYGRDDRYRERSPGRHRGRSASPAEDFPLPMRRPEEIPEVQVFVTDRVDRNFIWFLRKTFEERFIKLDVMDLAPHLPIQAAVRQVIVEGVVAAVFLNPQLLAQGKVSVQVFDRSPGGGNVRYDEYSAVDIPIAAEIVVRAKQKQQAVTALQALPQLSGARLNSQLPGFNAPLNAGAGQYNQFNSSQTTAGRPVAQSSMPNAASLLGSISNLDPSTLQTVIAALQQQQQYPGQSSLSPANSYRPK
ncbi:hypothetical protein V1511DRAFT_464947 [Dipodascopsis uninucleata]